MRQPAAAVQHRSGTRPPSFGSRYRSRKGAPPCSPVRPGGGGVASGPVCWRQSRQARTARRPLGGEEQIAAVQPQTNLDRRHKEVATRVSPNPAQADGRRSQATPDESPRQLRPTRPRLVPVAVPAPKLLAPSDPGQAALCCGTAPALRPAGGPTARRCWRGVSQTPVPGRSGGLPTHRPDGSPVAGEPAPLPVWPVSAEREHTPPHG